MIALCVDDEVLLLESLKRAVEASPDVEETAAFDDEHEAIEWAAGHRVDVAFLDVRLHDMNGIELAGKLREIHPHLNVVFCTGYREYAFDAFQMHASGYLTKPIRPEAVQKELDHILGQRSEKPLLRVQCFGSFEVYAREEPLHFHRAKTKELLAYLIDRRGASASTREICVELWEGKIDEKNGMNYLHQLASDLRKSLKNAGAEAVLLSGPQGYAVDPTRIDCDYYRYLEGEERAIRSFTGEYMAKYSWAEYTCAFLQAKSGIFPRYRNRR